MVTVLKNVYIGPLTQIRGFPAQKENGWGLRGEQFDDLTLTEYGPRQARRVHCHSAAAGGGRMRSLFIQLAQQSTWELKKTYEYASIPQQHSKGALVCFGLQNHGIEPSTLIIPIFTSFLSEHSLSLGAEIDCDVHAAEYPFKKREKLKVNPDLVHKAPPPSFLPPPTFSIIYGHQLVVPAWSKERRRRLTLKSVQG